MKTKYILTLRLVQLTYPLTSVVQDKIFFSALLGSTATVAVTIGGVKVAAAWENVPDGGIGIYHGSVPFTGKSGAVIVRSSSPLLFHNHQNGIRMLHTKQS